MLAWPLFGAGMDKLGKDNGKLSWISRTGKNMPLGRKTKQSMQSIQSIQSMQSMSSIMSGSPKYPGVQNGLQVMKTVDGFAYSITAVTLTVVPAGA